jgi:hypothetical protein
MGESDGYAGGVALVVALGLFVVLGAFAPDLLRVLSELGRWGIGGAGY